MLRIMMKEWRDMLPFAALYLLACLVVGRGIAPFVPALDAGRAVVAALLALGFAALAAARSFAGERALGTLEFTASLPVGRGTLFAGKTTAALLAGLAGSLAVAACFGVGPEDFSPKRDYDMADILERAAGSTGTAGAGVLASSTLLLFAAVLSASVAGVGEMAAIALGALIWILGANAALGLAVSRGYNPILANLLPALGLLAAAWHLFARGEPFDGSRRAQDLGRAALVLAATVPLLHLAALAASPPATEADLAGRALHARHDAAGRCIAAYTRLALEGDCRFRTRVPWWDPFGDADGLDRRRGWIDPASGEVRLARGRRTGTLFPSPDRKRCLSATFDRPLGYVSLARYRIELEGPAPGLPRVLAERENAPAERTFAGDPLVAFWRPDGSRVVVVEPGNGGAIPCTVFDPATGRPTRTFTTGIMTCVGAVWGERPDDVALLPLGVDRDDATGRQRFRYDPPFDAASPAGQGNDPFLRALRPGETLTRHSTDGTWLLALAASGTGQVLLARRPGDAVCRRHPVPDGCGELPGSPYEWNLIRYDPAGFLYSLPGISRDGGPLDPDARTLAWRRLDLAAGTRETLAAEFRGVPRIVRDTAGRPILLALRPSDGARERAVRWYRLDPRTLEPRPANFERTDSGERLTYWPEWLPDAILLGGTAYCVDERDRLLSYAIPETPNVTCFPLEKPLLPCPHCGR